MTTFFEYVVVIGFLGIAVALWVAYFFVQCWRLELLEKMVKGEVKEF